MLRAFRNFIETEQLFNPSDRVLLAVSGGMDSMTMLSLFTRGRFSFGVAHCNFQLRGNDSDLDEAFVESEAAKTGIPFYSKKFSTAEYAKVKNISIQMAARELRYDWFSDLLKEEGYDYIATAHHLDDQEETFFINLLRSSGIAGFHGINVKSPHVIRPLLFASRKQIENYVKKNSLPFREDKTNKETKYLRNRIRQKLIPLLRDISPGFSGTLNDNIARVRETEMIFRETVEKARIQLVKTEKGKVFLSVPELKKLKPVNTYIYEFLAPFDFNFSVCRDIARSLDETESRIFFSPTHQLIKEREQLFITLIREKNEGDMPLFLNQDTQVFCIGENDTTSDTPVRLKINKVCWDESLRFDPSGKSAYFDFQKLVFPLEIRRWEKGDTFYPFGMQNRKKLSDYFTDEKFSRTEKENTWLLSSGGRIIWVIGHRSDNRFRVTKKTKEVLVFHMEE